MKINKAIWKTAGMAAVVTLVGMAFIMRLGDWSKGLNSEFVVYGQTSVGGGGGTATTAPTVTKVIPQIAVGSFDGNLTKYSTIVEIVNTGSAAVSVQGNFYKSGDGTASGLTFSTNLAAVPTITGGVFPTTSLPANSILVISGGPTAGNTPPTYEGDWGKIQATGNISVATFFELRDGATNVLYSRVGVAASAANMAKFVVPRVRNVAAGFDVAFAIVNTGTTSATLTATLRDANGGILGAPKVVSLAPGVQTAKFTGQLFGLVDEPAGTSYSFITFESTSAQFAAIALAFEGAQQSSFPVEQLQ